MTTDSEDDSSSSSNSSEDSSTSEHSLSSESEADDDSSSNEDENSAPASCSEEHEDGSDASGSDDDSASSSSSSSSRDSSNDESDSDSQSSDEGSDSSNPCSVDFSAVSEVQLRDVTWLDIKPTLVNTENAEGEPSLDQALDSIRRNTDEEDLAGGIVLRSPKKQESDEVSEVSPPPDLGKSSSAENQPKRRNGQKKRRWKKKEADQNHDKEGQARPKETVVLAENSTSVPQIAYSKGADFPREGNVRTKAVGTKKCAMYPEPSPELESSTIQKKTRTKSRPISAVPLRPSVSSKEKDSDSESGHLSSPSKKFSPRRTRKETRLVVGPVHSEIDPSSPRKGGGIGDNMEASSKRQPGRTTNSQRGTAELEPKRNSVTSEAKKQTSAREYQPRRNKSVATESTKVISHSPPKLKRNSREVAAHVVRPPEVATTKDSEEIAEQWDAFPKSEPNEMLEAKSEMSQPSKTLEEKDEALKPGPMQSDLNREPKQCVPTSRTEQPTPNDDKLSSESAIRRRRRTGLALAVAFVMVVATVVFVLAMIIIRQSRKKFGTDATGGSSPISQDIPTCNGMSNLCKVRLNEQMYPVVDAVGSAAPSRLRKLKPNDQFKQHLADGYRGFRLSLAWCDNSLHTGDCVGGSNSVALLSQLMNFLTNNRRDFVLLLVEREEGVSMNDLASLLWSVQGLTERMYSHPSLSGPWPLLETVLDQQQQILIFENSGFDESCVTCPDGLHSWERYTVETDLDLISETSTSRAASCLLSGEQNDFVAVNATSLCGGERNVANMLLELHLRGCESNGHAVSVLLSHVPCQQILHEVEKANSGKATTRPSWFPLTVQLVGMQDKLRESEKQMFEHHCRTFFADQISRGENIDCVVENQIDLGSSLGVRLSISSDTPISGDGLEVTTLTDVVDLHSTELVDLLQDSSLNLKSINVVDNPESLQEVPEVSGSPSQQPSTRPSTKPSTRPSSSPSSKIIPTKLPTTTPTKSPQIIGLAVLNDDLF